jgi:hypothetical protein
MTPPDPYHANVSVETPVTDAAAAVCARFGVRAFTVHRGVTEFSTAAESPRFARPRAPVASGRDEIAARSLRLLFGRCAVSEDAAFARPHLEQPEVLAVLGIGVEARLAMRHPQGLAAIRPEDPADDRLRRFRLRDSEPPGQALPTENCSACLRSHARTREISAVEGDLATRLGRESRVGEEPLVVAEEPEYLAVVLQVLGEGMSRFRRRMCRTCTRRRRHRRRGNHYERERA